MRWRGGLEASPTGTWCEAPLGLLFDMLVARPCSNPSNAIRVSGGLDRVGLVREDYVMRPIVVVGVGVGVGVWVCHGISSLYTRRRFVFRSESAERGDKGPRGQEEQA